MSVSSASSATIRPQVARQRRRPVAALALVLCAQLMVILDMTIVNVALPSIERGLHFSATSLSWVLNAYALAFGGLLLLGGRAGDILGRRRSSSPASPYSRCRRSPPVWRPQIGRAHV